MNRMEQGMAMQSEFEKKNISVLQKSVSATSDHIYLAIDLKSFYASVECRERGLDPLITNLVVADLSRTEKTICLAVSPALKEYGIPGRPRLFQVIQKVQEINRRRARVAPNHKLTSVSFDASELDICPNLAVDYIVAAPRMRLYMEYSTQIYHIYLRYIAPEDIHVYSIDEVFIDLTHYMRIYGKTPEELARTMMEDVLYETGITATAGIGSNLYLCKVAMDIEAKHLEPDANGMRIARLDEYSYRERLWNHRPLTDFWRVGPGYAKKLEQAGLYTMGDIARCSLGEARDPYNEEMLYRMFGINAELLIDHAWGWEPCTISEIKAYKPENHSLGSGQVLQCPYSTEKAKVVIQEMAEDLALELVDKRLVTDQMVLTVGYEKKLDGSLPKQAHGSLNLKKFTSSSRQIVKASLELYDRIINPRNEVRRMYVVANHVKEERLAKEEASYEQLELFHDYEKEEQERKKEQAELEKEKQLQKAMLNIKKKFGKNAVLKGVSFKEGATGKERNRQIGGHKA